mmetsp:Transcript_15530/g.33729  ORF Transcript_15530/g.33729 Transcript_15530/m.33729 type:complete len:346 (-) Transcript_15530:556-1593(-)
MQPLPRSDSVMDAIQGWHSPTTQAKSRRLRHPGAHAPVIDEQHSMAAVMQTTTSNAVRMALGTRSGRFRPGYDKTAFVESKETTKPQGRLRPRERNTSHDIHETFNEEVRSSPEFSVADVFEHVVQESPPPRFRRIEGERSAHRDGGCSVASGERLRNWSERRERFFERWSKADPLAASHFQAHGPSRVDAVVDADRPEKPAALSPNRTLKPMLKFADPPDDLQNAHSDTTPPTRTDWKREPGRESADTVSSYGRVSQRRLDQLEARRVPTWAGLKLDMCKPQESSLAHFAGAYDQSADKARMAAASHELYPAYPGYVTDRRFDRRVIKDQEYGRLTCRKLFGAE